MTDSRMVLIHGDCLDEMKKIQDKSIDMVMCDLPYGTTQNEWDVLIPFNLLWEQYYRIVKNNGAIVLTSQSPFDKILAMSNIKDFKYEWIWEKNKATGHLNAKKMPMKSHENVLVFYRSAPTYNPQMTYGHKPMNAVSPKTSIESPSKKRNYNHVGTTYGNKGGGTSRYPRDVIRMPVINNDNPDKFHPTQKPVELMEYFILTYTNEGDTVLDNTMGSGSTGVAALKNNRKFVGIEKDKEYFDKAVEYITRSISTATNNKSSVNPSMNKPDNLFEF